MLLKAAFPENYRIVPGRYQASPLGTSRGDSRFCTCNAGYTVLYSSPDFATVFIETVMRDRFTRGRKREVDLKEITERVWVHIGPKPGEVLTLLDLRGDGCARIGAPTDVVRARNHAAGRAFAKAIYAEHTEIDGLLYPSRLTGQDVYGVFDRGIEKLRPTEKGMLADHPELPDLLTRHGIVLLA